MTRRGPRTTADSEGTGPRAAAPASRDSSREAVAREEASATERARELRSCAARADRGWAEACLEAAVEDAHPHVRAEAADALDGAPDRAVVAGLAAYLGGPAPAHRFRALRLLVRREPTAAAEALAVEARSSEPGRRGRAVEALGRLGEAGVGPLEELAREAEPALRARVAKALGTTAEPGAAAVLSRLAGEPDRQVRLAAARSLARLAEHRGASEAFEAARPALRALAAEADPALRRLGLLAAARAGGLEDAEPCLPLEAEDRAVAAACMSLLARLGRTEPLVAATTDRDEWRRRAAAFALAGLAEPSAEAADLLRSGDPAVRLAGVRALGRRPELWRGPLRLALADQDAAVRWLARRAASGKLRERLERGHRERPTAAGPSARWPFGLPAPTGEQAPRRPLAVATVNLSYNLNLGVLIRSAEAAGASHFLVAGREVWNRGTAMGTDRWLDLRSFDTYEAMLAEARSLGYQLVAVQQSPGAERFDLADYPPRPCLMLGSEGQGLPAELCAAADLVVEIPMVGAIDSINVASAGAIVLWACLGRLGWLEPGADPP